MDARYTEYIREETYRLYITDSLFYQARGKAFTLRYEELLDRIYNKPQEPEPTGDEIVQDIMTKYGLRFKENDTI